MMYRLLAVLAIFAVIVGTLLLDRQGPAGTESAEGPAGNADLGYAAREAQIVETGADGLPRYTLDAELIRQRAEDGVVTLETVRMQFRDANESLWHVTAERGEIRREAGLIALAGDVRVDGALPDASGAPQAVRVLTDSLQFDTDSQIVSTTAPVTLEWSGQRVSAVGMQASLKDHRVQLESAVHGIFSP